MNVSPHLNLGLVRSCLFFFFLMLPFCSLWTIFTLILIFRKIMLRYYLNYQVFICSPLRFYAQGEHPSASAQPSLVGASPNTQFLSLSYLPLLLFPYMVLLHSAPDKSVFESSGSLISSKHCSFPYGFS